jgi:hypothetical protein
MITTEIYHGQGLGNQLACYITTRVVALDKGFKFGIMCPEKFKCLDFMNLDFGEIVTGGSGPEGGPPTSLPDGIQHYFKERYNLHPEDGSNITIDDPKLENIRDNTKLDGIFQSENRIIHRKEEIKQWLKVNEDKECYEYSNENICIINFRGGVYAGVPSFFLPQQYWINAVNHMLQINPNFRFVVITDDVYTAKHFFPTYEVYHFSIAKDYSIIKNAHYLILSNSSFPYYATLTSETIKYILAPKYWGRHNKSDGAWSCGYNIYRNHVYLDKCGTSYTYDDCIKEFEIFKTTNNIYNEL